MKTIRRASRFPQPLPLEAPTAVRPAATPGPAPVPGPAPRPSVLNATMPTAIPQRQKAWSPYERGSSLPPQRTHPALERAEHPATSNVGRNAGQSSGSNPQHARPVEPPAIVPNPGARDGELGIAEVDGLLGDVLREIAGAK